MTYIIDGSIAYNSDDCTLSHIPTQESLSLSISSGRLFECLLKSEGEILARDTLLTEVWDKYGLRGSNSNLNQYLSILRRALAAYGCENLIITIPKVGIRLNSEIHIEQVADTPALVAEATPVDEGVSEALPHTSEPAQTAQIHSPTLNGWVFSLIIAAILLVGMGVYHLLLPSPDPEITPVTITLTGGCDVVLLQGLDAADRPALDKQILQMLSENHQTCDTSRRIYFDNNTSFTPQNYGRTLLSSCRLNSDRHIISCDNFYYLDWRMK